MNNDGPTGGIATPDTAPTLPAHASVPPLDSSLNSSPAQAPVPEPTPPPPHWSRYAPPSAPGSPYYPYYPPAQPQRPRSGVHWGRWVLGGLLGILLLGSLAAVLIAVLLSGLIATVSQIEQTAVTTKTFAFSGAPSLVVSDAAGNVTIQQGSGNHVTAQVTKHVWAGNTTVARRELSTVVVNVTQSGNVITVNAQFNTNVFDGGMTRRSVDLLITAPAQANADVNLGAGNIEASQISGAIKLVSGAGNLTLNGVTFERTSLLDTGAGNITSTCAIGSGANVWMRIGAGNATVTMPADTPAHLVASTGVGNMTITGWTMPMMGPGVGHHTAGDMSPHPTATLTIRIGTGNLTMMSR
jgi:hypothetical protein